MVKIAFGDLLFDYKVEGDDTIIFLFKGLTASQLKTIVRLYESVGFGVKVEFYGPPSGATFVKLVLVKTS